MTDHIATRKHYAAHYSKEISQKFDKEESYRNVLKGACKSILTFDSPNQPPSTAEFVGDYTKPNFGIEESTFFPKFNSPEISPLFKSSSKPLKIMDFACGGGILDLYLAPYIPQNSEIVGIDIAANQLDLFKKRVPEINGRNPALKITLAELDILNDEYNKANNLKYPKSLQLGTFDMIFTTSSYHHFDSVAKITMAMKDYLKVGGVLIILDMYDGKSTAVPEGTDNELPAFFSPKVLKEYLSGFDFSDLKTGVSYKYFQCFNEKDARSYLSESKFDLMFKDAITREVNGNREYVLSAEMTISVCRK